VVAVVAMVVVWAVAVGLVLVVVMMMMHDAYVGSSWKNESPSF
jgi:hypothetical protein